MKFIEIIIKAIKFDSSVYKLAKENKSYTKYSLFVVLVASLFTGVGTSIMTESSSIPKELISSLIGWILWSTVIYVLGTRILGYEATFTELLRTLGIAYSPGVMNIFGIINEISIFVIGITLIWTIFSFIYAVKETLNCSPAKAFIISISGFIAHIAIKFFIFTI